MDNNENNVEKETVENIVEKATEDKAKVNPINKLKLAIYIGLVLVPMVTLITMICSSIIDYSRWPIYTETNIRKQNEANFPAITFCPAHVGYKADVLKVKLVQYDFKLFAK